MVRPLDPQNARLLVEPVYGPAKYSALPRQWRRRQRAGKSLTDRPRSDKYPVIQRDVRSCRFS